MKLKSAVLYHPSKQRRFAEDPVVPPTAKHKRVQGGESPDARFGNGFRAVYITSQ